MTGFTKKKTFDGEFHHLNGLQNGSLNSSFVHASELYHGPRDFRDGTTNDHQAEDAQQNVEETLCNTSVRNREKMLKIGDSELRTRTHVGIDCWIIYLITAPAQSLRMV